MKFSRGSDSEKFLEEQRRRFAPYIAELQMAALTNSSSVSSKFAPNVAHKPMRTCHWNWAILTDYFKFIWHIVIWPEFKFL